MHRSNSRSGAVRILVFAVTALLSGTALALSLTWQFGGESVDQRPFSASLSFDDAASPVQVFTSTNVIEDPNGGFITDTITTEVFDVDLLQFTLGNDVAGSATGGSIIQANGPGAPFVDQYTVEGDAFLDMPGAGSITTTLKLLIEGDDFFNSLLVDTTPLVNALPGSFQFFDGTTNVVGLLTSLSRVTAVPEPWTLGLMASGLGSLVFLLPAWLRSRRDEE